MFREIFLALSSNPLARGMTTRFPLSRRMIRRFVAGETLEEAVEAVAALNREGMLASLDPLGENVSSREQAEIATDEILRIVAAIVEHGLESTVSIKLTQTGLDIGTELCRANVARILEAAQEAGVFVRIDMEGSEYTAGTLDVYHSLRERFDNLGIVIQAYLHRSEADIARICSSGGNVRLCKGAYREPPSIAFAGKQEVDRSFVDLLERLFDEESRATGTFPAIATHDEALVDWVRDHVEARRIDRESFEFQMLYGIRRDLQQRLRSEGFRIRVYVPFGSQWYPYFMRRLAERPANLVFLMKNLVSG